MAPNGNGPVATFSQPPIIANNTSKLDNPRSETTDSPPEQGSRTVHNTIAVTNLKCEADRRRTFTNWPVLFMDPNKLAEAGFYYLQKADLVRCAFCNIEIGKWEEGDDPMRDHLRWKPHCPFLKRQNVGNVPFGQENITQAPSTSSSDPQSYDTCGPYGIEVRPFSGPEKGFNNPSLENLGIHKSTGPLWKNYSTIDARLRSFTHWPLSLKQKPGVLSDAGFYYTGKGDQTICFHCGGGLKDWEDFDDPWVEHALWFPKCTYTVLRKGKAFVDQVLAEKNGTITCSEARDIVAKQVNEPCEPIAAPPALVPAEEKSSSGKDEGRLCKICFIEELGVLFLPCGHIVACVKCAPSLSACAVCRQPFTATVRAYLP